VRLEAVQGLVSEEATFLRERMQDMQAAIALQADCNAGSTPRVEPSYRGATVVVPQGTTIAPRYHPWGLQYGSGTTVLAGET
jgi:hypothetical protein